MRILSRDNHTLQIYPRGFRWCLREAAFVALLAAGVAGVAHALGML